MEKGLEAECLIDLELELNKIKFNQVEIGSLLAAFFGNIYFNPKENKLSKKVFLLFLLHYRLFRKVKKTIVNKNMYLYYQTGKHRHLNNISGIFRNDDFLSANTIVLDGGKENSNVFNNYGFLEIINVWLFVLRNSIAINSIVSKNFKSIPLKIALFCEVIIQLFKAASVKQFLFSQPKLKLIVGDFDRGNDTCVLFAVSKSLRIESFTLQHGAINPPYGYVPIIADQIWVWGLMAQKQLIDLNVSLDQITIVGSPIIDDYHISEHFRTQTVNKYKLKENRTIILALSSPIDSYNVTLVSFFKEIKLKYGNAKDNFFVKLHPSTNSKNYSWIVDDFEIDILPQEVTFEELINITDYLLIHSSGIANEALFFGVKIGVLDILPFSAGNGLELNKYFEIPLIKDISDCIDFFQEKKLTTNKQAEMYQNIGHLAKSGIRKKVYERFT
jgi:hypothetical protein